MNQDEHTGLSGLGLGATMTEALKFCDWKGQDKAAPWVELDYLSLGVSSHDEVPRELGPALQQAGLAVGVHLLELNLVQPLQQQREVVRGVLENIERIEPVCIEEDVGLWKWGSMELLNHMLPPVFDQPTAIQIARNIAELQASAGVPFYAENPPVYYDLGDVDLLSFMTDVAERARCGLVLDIGHLVGYCVVTGREPEDYLAQWSGFEHVRELHVAGFELLPDEGVPMWYDNHAAEISDYTLDLVAQARREAGRDLPVTLEQEGAKLPLVAQHIRRVRGRLSC